MDSARWEQIQTIFHQALELPESDRSSFLKTACGEDAQLAGEVDAMLRADSRDTSLLDQGLHHVAHHVLNSPTAAMPHQEFGPYRLLRVLGEGGMGVVWLAQRQDAGNLVAIKFLPHAALSPARRERFTHEIKTLGKLKHPFIARLYDAGSLADGTPWFVMEYVEGVRFTDHCREKKLNVEDRLRLFRSACEAVQYAHGQEIIHRDLKPSNILVDDSGSPRLLDFGIARELRGLQTPAEQTQPGLRFMSPDYAAPEWIREGDVGFYTDVYSLGVILYEILSGQLPFDRSQANADAQIFADAIAPSTATRRGPQANLAPQLSKAAWADLDVLCLKAVHKDARQRYSSAEALIRDINHYLEGEPLEARPDSVRYRTTKFVSRNWVAVTATGAAVCLIACVIVFYTVRLTKARNSALAQAARTARIQEFMLNLFQGTDKDAGPSEDLRVVTLIDRGVPEAQSLSKEPAVQAELYQTLGTMYEKLGKLDRANTLLQASLKERGSLAYPDDSGMVRGLTALGLLRSDQGRAQEGEALVRQALALIATRDPRNRVLLAKTNSALGQVLIAAGKYDAAIAVLNHALSLQPGEGAPTPEISEILSALADAQMYRGNYSDSDALNQRALVIDRQIYGDGDPHVADDLANLAETQELWGHYAAAERYERQALSITEAWYGKDHSDTARKMARLAGTLMYEGEYRQADDLLQRALAIHQKAYGNMHLRVAHVLNLLGATANQLKKFPAAEVDFSRAAEIYRSALGDGDYRVAVAMGNLASVYLAEKNYARAEPMFRDVLRRNEKELPPGNINTAIVETKLGRTLLAERRYTEAERYTRAGYEALMKQTSPSTIFIQKARRDLAAIYEALHQPQEAQKFRNEPAVADSRSPKFASSN
jgi:serine/threonine protein kinase/Tfp pilus assembly protein PilF